MWHQSIFEFLSVFCTYQFHLKHYFVRYLAECRVVVKSCVCSLLDYWVAWVLGSIDVSSLYLWLIHLTKIIIGGSGDSLYLYNIKLLIHFDYEVIEVFKYLHFWYIHCSILQEPSRKTILVHRFKHYIAVLRT